MSRRIQLPDDGYASIATDDEITVGQRNRLGTAITESMSVIYRLDKLSKLRRIELDGGLSDEEKALEAEMSPAEQADARGWRDQVAGVLALQDIASDDQYRISRHQRIRILCYLRTWSLEAPIPQEEEDFDDMSTSLFDALYEACSADLPTEPDFSKTPDNRVDPKAPTGDLRRSESSDPAKRSHQTRALTPKL